MRRAYDLPLAPYTTLRAGGRADEVVFCESASDLEAAYADTARRNLPMTVLGSGSNVLVSDAGVRGVVIINRANSLRIDSDGVVEVETGLELQELFLKTAQKGYTGFEFAVGIPGTLGGALVSNAGAYRSGVSERLTAVRIVEEQGVAWESPEWMRFSYRDSIFRREDAPRAIMTTARFHLVRGEPRRIYDAAREFQRQRIAKQPPSASAGSFFKNVEDANLARSLDGLPETLKAAGIVPAGYLIEAVGLKGQRLGGAMWGRRHANFMLNVRGATATDIRRLADLARERVCEKFGVTLEPEALMIGDWTGYERAS